MTLVDQFISNPPQGVNGQGVDLDNEFGAQCWDLAELYAEMLGVPKEPWAIPLGPTGSAKEAWTYFDQSPHMQTYFDKIDAADRQRGDINVYDGHGQYPEGHINIELGNGQVFEQNADPDGSPAHTSSRSTTYLLGSLRVKEGDSSMSTVGEIEFHDLYEAFFGPMIATPPTDDDRKKWIGAETNTVIRAMQEDPRRAVWLSAKSNTAKLTPQTLAPGIYQVE